MDTGTATLTFNAAVDATGDSYVEAFPQVTFKAAVSADEFMPYINGGYFP
jgi:hypothetical protein